MAESLAAVRARVARRLRDLRVVMDNELGEAMKDLILLEKLEAQQRAELEPEAHGGRVAGGVQR
jgi:hypothetical protein